MNLKDQAGRVAVLTALADRIAEALKAEKDALSTELAQSGVKNVTAELTDGTPVAKVLWVTPKPAAVVTDDAAFLAWVRQNAPTQLETKLVTTVRPAYVTALLKEMTAAGVPQWCDKETGVLHEVPGVAVRGRTPYQSTKFETTGREQIAAAWRAGHLAELVLPELEGGE